LAKIDANAKVGLNWSPWRAFPDPRHLDYLTAPIGYGCYELRRSDTGEKVLYGRSKNVAARMTSLLPAPLGAGRRNNADKRQYVLNHAARIEHRTLACSSLDETLKVESELAKRGPYLFPS